MANSDLFRLSNQTPDRPSGSAMRARSAFAPHVESGRAAVEQKSKDLDTLTSDILTMFLQFRSFSAFGLRWR